MGDTPSRTLPPVEIPYGKPFHPYSPGYSSDGRYRGYKCFNQGVPEVHRSFWDNLLDRTQGIPCSSLDKAIKPVSGEIVAVN